MSLGKVLVVDDDNNICELLKLYLEKEGNGGYTREQVTGEAELAATEAVKTIAAETRYHKVKKGETLASIAKKYGMSVQEICRMNRISKSKRIKAGQILRCS